jgi:phosphoribosylglycinamide formyltransferase-1
MIATGSKKPFVAVCSGNGSGLAVLAEACRQGLVNYKLVGIVTDKACGAVHLGTRFGVPVTAVNHADYLSRRDFDIALKTAVLSYRPDTLLLYFDKLVDISLIEAMNGQVINTHYSLLPAFPGLKAISRAVKSGCYFSGVTLHYVDRGIDSGPILAQAVCPISASESDAIIGKRLFEISLPLTLAALRAIPHPTPAKGECFQVSDGSNCLCSLPIAADIRSFLANIIDNCDNHKKGHE